MNKTENTFMANSTTILESQLEATTVSQVNHSINILTFDHPKKTIVFGFNFKKKEGYHPLRSGEFPRELCNEFFHELKDTQYLYCNFSTSEDCDLQIEVDLSYSIRFAKHYYHNLITGYFKGKASIVHSNFVNNVELWYPNPNKKSEHYDVYEKYTLSVRLKTVSDLPELLVTHKGSSKVLTKNAFTLIADGTNTDYFKKMLHNGKLVIYDRKSFHFEDLQECYPILNRDLASSTSLPAPTPTINNHKYAQYYNFTTNFKDKKLCTEEFMEIIPHSVNWHPITEVYRTAPETSLLQFNKGTHIDPLEGFKQYQPYRSAPIGQYKFFFICHEKDKELAKTFHHYSTGKFGFINFQTLLNLPIQYASNLHINYDDNTTPTEAIKEKFSKNKLEPNINYLAIYISPYNKSETDPKHNKLYYDVKKILVDNGVSSQVIFNKNLNKGSFQYHVSNIAVAILAKLGGTPWCLKDKSNDELIIGIGAFKSKKFDQGYLGSTVCFSADGKFNGFKCLPSGNPRLLAGSIKEAIMDYKENSGEAKRLVIHFYKQMSNREIKPIIEKIREIGSDMPIVIVSINKTKSNDYVLFDNQYPNVMPYSGSYISIGRDNYILCNNTRYAPNESIATSTKVKSHPLPIKIHLQATDDNIINNNTEVKKLIEQVYQFSRLYWKSVSHQNIPVTVKYPEMLAEIFPHFKTPILTGFASKNLWFL